MARESRGAGGRLAFFVACLAVGVAAVVAVAGLSASLDEGIRTEARKLLAADLVVRSNRPLPADLDLSRALPRGSRVTRIRETVTVVAAPPSGRRPGRSQLAELKVVDGSYPFYGTLGLSPARPLSELLGPGTAVVAPELLSGLGLRVGQMLRIGGEGFEIAGTVASEPDRISVSLTLGPRVFLSGAGLERTGLAGRGSRVDHRLLVRLPAGLPAAGIDAVAERLRTGLPEGAFRVETYKEGQPALRENLKRVGRYLGLVALLSLLVGGIGVAQSVRAWLAGRLDAIAVLKCLGMRPREVLALYLGQTAVLGLAGSLAGMLAGAAVQLFLPSLFRDLIPAELVRPWQPGALGRGLALGLGVALLSSLPPLAGLLRVPPARVLRRDAEPLPVHRWAAGAAVAALVAGLFAMAAAQSGSWVRGAQFTAAVLAATAVLTGAALGVAKAVARAPRGFARLWLRNGLAALGRPGATTVGAIVALGLGVLVVLSMSLVERRLGKELARDLPAGSPSVFLIDIQPDQWPGVRRTLEAAGAANLESVPVVMARLTAIDGRGVDQIAGELARRRPERGSGERDRHEGRREDRGRRWALTREQRLTYLSELPKDNRLVEGRLWSDPAHAEVSLERDYAEDLGVGVGSTLTFDVQGVPFDLRVTSLRTVDWSTFGINFFLVVEPGVLEEAPQQRIAAARLPPGGEQRVQDLLAARYPNVTLLKIREVLAKILRVLGRIGLGVRVLGGFTVVAGIAILAGAVSAGSARRGREVALLKTLGMTRRGVAASFAVEYALVGLVAGAIGACGGTALAWGVLTRGFELSWRFEPLPLATAVSGSVLLAVAAGLAASARALQRRPVEVLRGE